MKSYFLLIILHFIFRLPYFIFADKRMVGDETFHWLVLEWNLEGKHFTLRPYGHDYLGITDSLFSIPFVLVLGNIGLALYLGLFLEYIFYSIILLKITDKVFSRKVNKILLILLVLPNPFIMSVSAMYLSGHFIGSVLGITAFYILIRKKTTLFNSFLIFFLIFLSYYSSKLTILYVPFLVFIWAYKLFYYKKFSLSQIFVVFLGSSLGLLVLYLASIFTETQPIHNKNALLPGFEFFKENLSQIFEIGIPAMAGLLYKNYAYQFGFYPKGLMKLISGFTYMFFIFICFSLIIISLKILKKLIRRKYFSKSKFIILFIGYILFINIIALLSVNLNDPYVIRYLTPYIIISPIFIAYLLYKNKYLKYLYLFILLYGYIIGYLNKDFYKFEGSPNHEKVYEYLKNENINFSFSSYWIGYHLIKISKGKHISSGDNKNYLGAMYYPKLHQIVYENSKKEKIAIISLEGEKKEFPNQIKGNYIYLEEGIYEIMSKKEIPPWNIYIVKYKKD